jgi:midasin
VLYIKCRLVCIYGFLKARIYLQVGKEFAVVNLSNQSDACDLLGGFKPLRVGAALVPLASKFARLMRSTWPAGKNEDFLSRANKFAVAKNWAKLIQCFEVALKKVLSVRV